MPRLLVLLRPYHLRREEAEAWLGEELADVLRRDRLGGASVTVLEDARENPRDRGSLIELDVDDRASTALEAGGACGQLLADMRLLGMAPPVALAAERKTIDPRPS